MHNLTQVCSPFFPGSVNQNGDSASARIQLRMELKSGAYQHLQLQGYRDNDQKYAPHITKNVTAGSLVIRDLGYYVIDVFKQLDDKGVYFLSRYHSRSAIYDQSGARINLAQHLRKLRKNRIPVWDKQVRLGYNAKMPVRIIAIKAPLQVEQQRKRKANRDRRAKHSADYYELLGWTILITNVPAYYWSPEQALQVYGFRWRIEIIFKCWKSNFDCKKLFKQKNSLSHPRILICFYLLLVIVMLCFVHSYWIAFNKVYQQTGKVLSLIKFGRFLKLNHTELFADLQETQTIQFLARYFCQTKRKLKSHTEMIYVLNSS
ncbi:MAG: IS4 family transposase [Bacteroidota bacterium]